jgi:outer membrane protein OmpA-like peptidoglycan-associated protein
MAFQMQAQNPTAFRKNGDAAFFAGQWPEALTGYAQYQELKPGDPTVLTRIGICHFQLRQGEQAREYLEYVQQRFPDNKDPDRLYYLARTAHGLGDFDRAIEAYKSFLRITTEKHPLYGNVIDNIRRCGGARYLAVNPGIALVENLGDRINSAGDEFAPLLSRTRSNRLYFSAARPGCTGGKRDDKGFENEQSGKWCADMFFADQSLNGWDYAAPLNSLLNTPRHEVALGFSEDGMALYYFRGFTRYSGSILIDTAGINDEHLLLPTAFEGPMHPEDGDVHAYFLEKNAIVFSSRRPGGFGGLDLYLSTRFSDGTWSEGRNLGPVINSPYDEDTPFLSADGQVLYFSSNRLESMGGLDVFRAVYDPEKQQFNTPENLGIPVNSPFDDAWFQIASDGNSAFFASDRFESMGARDLFVAYYLNTQEEQAEQAPPFFASVKTASPGSSNRIEIPIMYYTDDRDVLRKENIPTLEQIAALARSYPESIVQVFVHTHESGPAKFDLYYGIKRAELVAKALTERGIEAARIELLSAGPFYPQALNTLNGQLSAAGQAYNRRFTCRIMWPSDQGPISTVNPVADIPEQLYLAQDKIFRDNNEGLTYKLEVAETRQLLHNEALGMFDDQHIESTAGTGTYRYTLGWVRTYQEARALRKVIQDTGFSTAQIYPYLHGRRLSRAQVIKYLKQFPDLAAYLKG